MSRDDRATRIRIIGDHSDYHCGSAAAYQAIMAACTLSGCVVGEDDDFDLLVVNGEGSMHHDSPSCRRKLAEIAAATTRGKRVQLINTVWQENSAAAAEVLRACERVVVREVLSQRELERIGACSEVMIDQSFFAPIESASPVVDFGGQMVLTDFFSRDLGTFAKVTTQWTWSVPYIQMHEWTWSSLVRSLPSASVLVTGRHHAMYAACKARVPFLVLKGNTHKIEGLLASSGVDIPVFDTYPELRQALRSHAWKHYDFAALFDWMEAQQPWRVDS